MPINYVVDAAKMVIVKVNINERYFSENNEGWIEPILSPDDDWE